jgi:hypothetical protein
MFVEAYHPPRTEYVQHPVCRFLVQSLCCSKGRAKSDFFVDLVLSVDGLLILVKSVYGVLKNCQRLDESYRTLQWRLHFQGNVFTLADPEVHHFRFTTLHDGQTGWFEGSTVSFRFTVFETHVSDICASQVGTYPRIEVAPHQTGESPITSTGDHFNPLKDDLISEEPKTRSLESRKTKKNIGEESSYETHRWTTREDCVVTNLTESGFTLEESCQENHQFVFIKKTKSVAAKQRNKLSRVEQVSPKKRIDQPKPQGAILLQDAKVGSDDVIEGYFGKGVPQFQTSCRKRPVEQSRNCKYTVSGGIGIPYPLPKRRRVVSLTVMTPPSPVVPVVDKVPWGPC